MLLRPRRRLLHRGRVFTRVRFSCPEIVVSSFRPFFAAAAFASVCAFRRLAWCDRHVLRWSFYVAAGVVGDGKGPEAFVDDGGECWGAADDDGW